MLRVIVTSPERLLYEGPAHRVVFPGEQGVFEVLSMHRPVISRLVMGALEINDAIIPIQRGIVRVADDVVTAVVEMA